VSGLSLAALKYAVDALVVYAMTGLFWSPLAYLNPIFQSRTESLSQAPEGMLVALTLFTLPFLWVGISMSVRRAVDAGLSAWAGLVFLVPVLNYPTMLLLAALPSKDGARWSPDATSPYRAGAPQKRLPLPIEPALASALLGFGAALFVGLAMVGISVFALGAYGTALFFITPFVMGSTSAFLYNKPYPRPLSKTLGVALLSVIAAGSALLIFALEGLVCLIMALPIAGVLSLIGAVVGRTIALNTATTLSHSAAMLLILPGAAGADAALARPELREVMTAIEVDAPPEQVWPNVIGFSDLDPPTEWYFHTGLSYPMRARISGQGVGAVRRCEFSTGAFVEPITVWDAPNRLSFDVTEQPIPMQEWSPYQRVYAPHLEGGFQSKRGEFRLTALPGGRTRLEGSTWYVMSMFPEAYWRIWAERLLHAIHGRVLRHVKHLSESPLERSAMGERIR